jgi:transposase
MLPRPGRAVVGDPALPRPQTGDLERTVAIGHQSDVLRLDDAGIPAADFATLTAQSTRSAQQWREDPRGGSRNHARLPSARFNETFVNAELFCQASRVFATFDTLLRTAQNRRIALLGAKMRAERFQNGSRLRVSR